VNAYQHIKIGYFKVVYLCASDI